MNCCPRRCVDTRRPLGNARVGYRQLYEMYGGGKGGKRKKRAPCGGVETTWGSLLVLARECRSEA